MRSLAATVLLEALELEAALAARLDPTRDDPDAAAPSARVRAMIEARKRTDQACEALAEEEYP